MVSKMGKEVAYRNDISRPDPLVLNHKSPNQTFSQKHVLPCHVNPEMVKRGYAWALGDILSCPTRASI